MLLSKLLSKIGRWTVRNARRNPTDDSRRFSLKQVALPASELAAAVVRMETCIIEQLDEIAENCKLSDKAMQALDRLKSLEGDNAGKTCEAAP